MTISTNFHKKGCWIINKWRLASDANKFLVRRKVSIKIDKLIFGLEEEVKIPGK